METKDKAESSSDTASRRTRRATERRDAILGAALAEFSENGFSAARMEDVAKRAGVAKGTIYLHFTDKRALFEGIVQAVIAPAFTLIESQEARPDETVRDHLERVLLPIAKELSTSPRREVIRLLMSEGERFPEMADVYFTQIVQRGISSLAELARRAKAEGAPGADAMDRFPQLVFAPALLGLVWSSLFEHRRHLDLDGMIRAQLDLMLGPPSPAQSSVKAS